MSEELIQSLQERIEELKKFAHVDTAVDLRTWCLRYGGHKAECATIKWAAISGDDEWDCDCGWDDVYKELTRFSDEFYEKFRKEK